MGNDAGGVLELECIGLGLGKLPRVCDNEHEA